MQYIIYLEMVFTSPIQSTERATAVTPAFESVCASASVLLKVSFGLKFI